MVRYSKVSVQKPKYLYNVSKLDENRWYQANQVIIYYYLYSRFRYRMTVPPALVTMWLIVHYHGLTRIVLKTRGTADSLYFSLYIPFLHKITNLIITFAK